MTSNRDASGGSNSGGGLSGEELEEYCLQHGICPLCARTKTHERIGPYKLKLAGGNNSNTINNNGSNTQGWEPLTVTKSSLRQQEENAARPAPPPVARTSSSSSSTTTTNKKGKDKKKKKKGGGLWGQSRGDAEDDDNNDREEAVGVVGEESAPIVITEDTKDEDFLVYKGLCLRRGCFTLEQAKRLSGDVGPFSTRTPTTIPNADTIYYCFNVAMNSSTSSSSSSSAAVAVAARSISADADAGPGISNGDTTAPTTKKKKGGMSKLFGSSKKKASSKKKKKSPAAAAADFDDSRPTQITPSEWLTKIRKTDRNDDGSGSTSGIISSAPTSTAPTTITTLEDEEMSELSSEVSHQSSRSKFSGRIRNDDDDNMSIGSAMTSASRVRRSLKELLKDQQTQSVSLPPGVCPSMVPNHTLMLDLSHTRLHHIHVLELVQAFQIATSLQTLILENCKLNDNELEVIGNGLITATMGGVHHHQAGSQGQGTTSKKNTQVMALVRLSVRSNKIGNRGVAGLCGYFAMTSTLKELDLSKNQFGSRGASSVLHAFRDNPHYKKHNDDAVSNPKFTGIEMINFSHNEIWDVDDGTFFAQNTTLKLLNLEGNFIHDEGVQAICDGLRINAHKRGINPQDTTTGSGPGTKLEHLYLGWNGIGDEGCLHLSRMIEYNTTIHTLGLGENDITSIGARALLNSLAFNDNTLNEITGLYHNQIDRKFVIEAILRILYSNLDTLPPKLEHQRLTHFEDNKRASMKAMDTLAEPLGSGLPAPDEVSEGSLDWADRLYNDETEFVVNVATASNTVPLLGEVSVVAPSSGVDDEEDDMKRQHAIDTLPEAAARMMSYVEMPEPVEYYDRVMILQAVPLVWLNDTTRVPIPQHDFDHEASILQNALESSGRFDAVIDVEVEPASVDNLTRFLTSGSSRVLHFTGYGHSQHVLALEDNSGDGYMDDSFSLDKLNSLVKEAPNLQLVVVNSFHSGRIGKAFVEAGVPHVVCCHHPEIFRDKAANSFLKNFYRGLATNKSLKQSFYHAQEAVRVEEISKHVERYVLLPREKSADDPYHDVPIFYTHSVPENDVDKDADILLHNEARKMIPKLPRYFIGREIEMCKALEVLHRSCDGDNVDNNDKVIRIGGEKGIGKTSLAIAVCRYIQQRQMSLDFEDVYWLPVAKGVVPEEDTLFADLAEYTKNMIALVNGDLEEDMDSVECRERIDIELEGRRCLLAIDSRQFRHTDAVLNLERFVEELINNPELDVRIILINSDDDEEDATIRVGPIDFKSNALLFGMISRFITANGCPAAQSPDEFADLMVPPSVANNVAEEQQQQGCSKSITTTTNNKSLRRERLMSVMGDGIPLEIIRVGKTMEANVFIRLIGMANAPEVKVDCIKNLEKATSKWTERLDHAVSNLNYFRAMDLKHVLKELQEQKSKFPSIDDLIAKEKDLHRRHTLCFKTRQYEEGNRIKREILTLKKQIMRERRLASSREQNDTTRLSSNLTQSQNDKIANIKRQMDSIMKLANSSFSSLNEVDESDKNKSEATFRLGSAYHTCEICIYPGHVEDFDPGDDLGAAVCWTNESCNVSLDDDGRSLSDFGGTNLLKDIKSLPGIAESPWGAVKCGIGNAVIVGPGCYDDLRVHCVILAVGPVSPTRDENFEKEDEDSLHYMAVMMRSCIRSAFILAKHSQVQSIAFPTLTTKVGSPTYESTLLTNLKLLVDEAKFSDLNTLHIVANSEEESKKLIEMALTMGLTMTSDGYKYPEKKGKTFYL